MSSNRVVVLENLRSAYNVGNIIRTADALWFDVIISWYTPSSEDEKVTKTSLWAEKFVKILEFWNTHETLEYLRSKNYKIVSAEITKNSISIKDLINKESISEMNVAIIMWNEVEWVLKETLENSDFIAHLPMVWKKESLNVGQAAAIFMWEFRNN